MTTADEVEGARPRRMPPLLAGVLLGVAVTVGAFVLPPGWSVAERARSLVGWSEAASLYVSPTDPCHPEAMAFGVMWVGDVLPARAELVAVASRSGTPDTGRIRRTSQNHATYRSDDGWTVPLGRKGVVLLSAACSVA